MFITLIIRKFENMLNFDKTDNMMFDKKENRAKVEVNFEKLKFLSTNEEISKLYINYDKDLNPMFYGKTKFKTFIHFHILDMNSQSNWFENIYIKWETYFLFISNFERRYNKKNFGFDYINHKSIIYHLSFEFIIYYFNKFTSIKDGNLILDAYEDFLDDDIKKITYRENIEKLFYYLIEDFEKYQIKNEKIRITEKIFYENYLCLPNTTYLDFYLSSYNELNDLNLMDPYSSLTQIHQYDNFKNPKHEIMSHEKINFFDSVTINKNKYIVLIYSIIEKVKLNDEINNLNIPEEYITKLCFKLKSVLCDKWYFYTSYSKLLNKTFQNIFDNCDTNKIYNNHIKSLIDIQRNINGEKLIISNSIDQMKINAIIFNFNFNILNKIAFITSNKKCLEVNDERIEKFKLITKTFLLKDSYSINSRYIFHFKIFSISKLTCNKPELSINSNSDNKNINYNTFFNRKLPEDVKKKFLKKQSKVENQGILLTPNYKILKNNSFIYFITVYNPKTSYTFFFIFSTKDMTDFFEKIHGKKLKKSFTGNYENMIETIPKKIKILEELAGLKIYIKYTTYKNFNKLEPLVVKKIKDKKLLKGIDDTKKIKKEIKNEKLNSLNIYLKPNYENLLIRENLYDICLNEMKLILKTVKYYEINKKEYVCLIAIYYHRILEYWRLILIFPHNQRKFSVNVHQSDILNIPKENYRDLPVLDTLLGISECDIWKFFIKNSIIISHKEGNYFIEIFNLRTSIKELLYQGYEMTYSASDTNQLIFLEIHLKYKNRFILNDIDEIVDKVQLDGTSIMLQAFSFEEFSWHKEIFNIEDYEDYLKDKIIIDESQIIVPSINQIYIGEDKSIKNKKENNIILNSNIRRFIKLAYLKKLAVFIVKSYRLNKYIVFEDRAKYLEKKGKENEKTIPNIIENIKNDRMHHKNVIKIFNKRLENPNSEKLLHSEVLINNPYILVNVKLNQIKDIVIISFYHPKKSLYNQIAVEINSIKDSFFPFFNDILTTDAKLLGKRIIHHYKSIIINSPIFMKFVRNVNDSVSYK